MKGLFNNHHFTTTHTSQQVEFFHSLILVIQHKMTEFERSFQPFMSKNLGIMGYFWKNWKALSKYGMKLKICTFRGTNSIDIRASINHSLRPLELSLSKVTKKQYYFVQKNKKNKAVQNVLNHMFQKFLKYNEPWAVHRAKLEFPLFF